jgi:hypothetical protein
MPVLYPCRAKESIRKHPFGFVKHYGIVVRTIEEITSSWIMHGDLSYYNYFMLEQPQCFHLSSILLLFSSPFCSEGSKALVSRGLYYI